MRSVFSLFLSALVLTSCSGQQTNKESLKEDSSNNTSVEHIDKVKEYQKSHSENNSSNSIGSVSNGKLENGSLIPFSGPNFIYFDTSSYLSGRAFTHSTVSSIIISAYDEMLKQGSEHHFQLMELSNEHGGKIFPHRTHQNGTSADFMMPLIKGNEPCYKYDSLGVGHYLMDFDDNGCVTGDSAVQINFDLVAQHILALEKSARNEGMKISKVIIKTSLKDELFATKHGRELKRSGIYVVRGLKPLINDLHDDHYHIDFTPL